MKDLLGIGLGVAEELLGGSAGRRRERRRKRALLQAGEEGLARTREMVAPLLAEQRFALPRLRGLLQAVYAPRAGSESPLLRASHGANLAAIGRRSERSLSDALRRWKSAGNIGRARGEQLRIGREAAEAENAERLDYASRQEAHRRDSADRYLSGLETLAKLGAEGLDPMESAMRSLTDSKMRAAGVGDGGGDELSRLLRALAGSRTGRI